MPWVTEEEIQAAKNMTAYEYLRKWSNDCNRIDERRIYRSDSDLLHGCSEKIR